MAWTPRGGIFPRSIGFLVFLGGVFIILGVLWLALEMWRDPALGLHMTSPGKTTPDLAGIGIGFGQLLVRIVLLFLGSFSGSLIANKGISLWLHDPQKATDKS